MGMLRCQFLTLPILLGFTALAGNPPKEILDTIHKTHFKRVARLQKLPPEVEMELYKALRLKYDKQRQEMERDPEFMANSPEERASFFKVVNWKIANPGEPWSPTDHIVDMTLPHRRLIYAGASPSLWFVFYEHGGIGRHAHVLVIGKEPQNNYWSHWLQFPKFATVMVEGQKCYAILGGRVTTSEEGFED